MSGRVSLDSSPLTTTVKHIWLDFCRNFQHCRSVKHLCEGRKEGELSLTDSHHLNRHLTGDSNRSQKDGLGLKILALFTFPVRRHMRQKASTIISFTGAVCLRTISFALGEEESADECSCLLSAQSRGSGGHCCNNFERQRWGGRREAASGKW